MLRHEAASLENAPRTAPGNCDPLQTGDEPEVLEFLAKHPIHTVFMASLIRDNGLISPKNRGSFYGCRSDEKRLEGVALIGHATMFEARTDRALAVFASAAAQCQDANLIRGERKSVRSFWNHLAAAPEPRRICRELLFEKRRSSPPSLPANDLRRATLADLEYVMTVNASLAHEEGGVNPMERDREGFRHRTARRINQGRVWIWVSDRRPIFKADVISDTPETIYLEGIYVHPDYRGKGYGKRGLLQLSSILLRQSRSICLTINQRKASAARFYARAGFDYHSEYETIYLR